MDQQHDFGGRLVHVHDEVLDIMRQTGRCWSN
jgi:hypothetical protein